MIAHNPLTHPAPVLQLLRALLRMAHTGTSDPRRPTLEMPSLYLLSIRVAHNQCRVVWKYKSPALWLQGGQTLRCNSSSRAPYRTRDQAGQGTSPKITVLLGSLPSLHDSPLSLTGPSRKHPLACVLPQTSYLSSQVMLNCPSAKCH